MQAEVPLRVLASLCIFAVFGRIEALLGAKNTGTRVEQISPEHLSHININSHPDMRLR